MGNSVTRFSHTTGDVPDRTEGALIVSGDRVLFVGGATCNVELHYLGRSSSYHGDSQTITVRFNETVTSCSSDEVLQYDPDDYEWKSIPTLRLPKALCRFAHVRHGESWYLIGGEVRDPKAELAVRPSSDYYRLSDTGTWEHVGALPSEFGGPMAAVAWQGQILVFLLNRQVSVPPIILDVDAKTMKLGPKPLALPENYKHVSLVSDGTTAWAIGGARESDKYEDDWSATGHVFSLSDASKGWQLSREGVKKRAACTAFLLGGDPAVIGGAKEVLNETGKPLVKKGVIRRSCEKLDRATGKWQKVTALSVARNKPLVTASDRTLFVVGGYVCKTISMGYHDHWRRTPCTSGECISLAAIVDTPSITTEDSSGSAKLGSSAAAAAAVPGGTSAGAGAGAGAGATGDK